MAELPIPTRTRLIRTPATGHDDWAYSFRWGTGEDKLVMDVVLSDSQKTIAGLGDPSPQWMFDRAREQTIGRLRNDVPVLEQVREWGDELVLRAPDR